MVGFISLCHFVTCFLFIFFCYFFCSLFLLHYLFVLNKFLVYHFNSSVDFKNCIIWVTCLVDTLGIIIWILIYRDLLQNNINLITIKYKNSFPIYFLFSLSSYFITYIATIYVIRQKIQCCNYTFMQIYVFLKS